MKKRNSIWKYIGFLMLVLAAAMGVRPVTAGAAEYKLTLSSNHVSNPALVGYTITIPDGAVYVNDTYETPFKVTATSITMYTSSGLKDNTVTLKFAVYFSVDNRPDIESKAAMVEATFAPDCINGVTKTEEITSATNDYSRLIFDYTITRPAGSHTGGNPTCSRSDICAICGSAYLDPENHNYSSEWNHDGEKHWKECTYNAEHKIEGNSHTGGSANCTVKAVCSVCGESYGAVDTDKHNWSNAVSNGDGTHTYTCSNDAQHTMKEDCSGSNSGDSCGKQLTCSVCKAPYGEVLQHKLAYTFLQKRNQIREKCERENCRHIQYADIVLQSGIDLTYCGKAIEPIIVEYPEGWLGERTQPVSTDYENNVKAGNARCIFQCNGEEVYRPFTIGKARITVTPDSEQSMVFGEKIPRLTYAYAGNVEGELPAFSGALGISGTDAGTQTITLGNLKLQPDKSTGFLPGNYTLVLNETPVDFNIARRAVTVAANDAGKTYGDADPELLTWQITEGSEFASEPLAVNISRAEGENTGSYAITVSQNEGANPNYDITFADGTFAIGVKEIIVTIDSKSSVYGEEIAALTATDNGIVNGDTDVYALATTAAAGSDAGKYDITGTALNDNYSITFANEEDAYEITKADPGIGTVSADVVYDTLELSAVVLSRENTNVGGTLTADAGQSLVVGENEIAWTFTPDGTTNYKTVTGKVTVTVKDTIADLTDGLKGKDSTNVTAEDKAGLQAIIDTAEELLKNENITAEKKGELEKIITDAKVLIDAIDAKQEITERPEESETETEPGTEPSDETETEPGTERPDETEAGTEHPEETETEAESGTERPDESEGETEPGTERPDESEGETELGTERPDETEAEPGTERPDESESSAESGTVRPGESAGEKESSTGRPNKSETEEETGSGNPDKAETKTDKDTELSEKVKSDEETEQAVSSAAATGDDSNIALWSGMLCMSALGLAVLLAGNRRRMEK